ncbi:WASH complex subunit 2C-like isoform X9 [Manis javanica]|uniref:WASH complex subunit 2C-like isoform X9 n=1 Tax=Manis javanica TaxID=9974 RepID=UPI003C6D0D39
MNGTTPDQERTPASEPVWERPWSVEEIRRSSQSWSLAADAGLLQFLQEFSQQTISRTHEIKKQVDGLIRETKATDCRLHNVFNDFLMLSNTQFIENRVYDEEVEEPVLKPEVEKAEQEKTREQKEVDLIPKVQEAVNYGLQVLDSAFEQLDIKAGNSDSEEDDANERVELILEPKDLYIDRPLPYLIGSKLFMEQEDVGLGELSSEEGSVGSDRGSIVDSDEENEEEESDEDFANRSDNDRNRHTAQMSDEEEEDDSCDIFADSEKEEEDTEDIEENTRPTKSRPTSFADELAARINGGAWSQKEEEQINEDDNFFVPPKLTDEDFSPFGSRGGLFSGGKGLFDGEEESDLFTDAPQDQEARASISAASSSSISAKKIPAGAVSVFLGDTDVFGATSAPSLKEPQKHEQPTAGQSPYLAAPTGLFDDTDDDDTFFAASSSKTSMTEKVTSIANIFDDEEGYLFKEKAVALPEATVNQTDEHQARAKKKIAISSSKNLTLSSETKIQKGLFSDEEDSEDLFSSQNVSKPKDASLLPSKPPRSASFFDDEDEEDNLFGTTAGKKQTSSLLTQSQEKSKSSEPSRKKASALLFSSDDEEDQWNITDSQTNSSSDNRSKGELRDSGTTQVQEAKAVKKTSLFEDDDEDDLFVIAKDSQRKTQRVSLLFEEDPDSGSSLFGSPPASVPPATKADLTIHPAALLPAVTPQISGTRPVLPELAFPSSEPGRTHSLGSMPTLSGSGEAGVSFDLPAQADTLHSANKSRVKVRGKRRPQTRTARRLAAQESSEAEDVSVPRRSVAQLADGTISPEGCQPQPRTAGGKDSEEAVATATPPWAGVPVLGMDGNSFAKSLGQPCKDDIFDSEDIFSKGPGSQSTGRKTVLVKAAESLSTLPGGSKEKSSVFPALGEAGSDDDLFQSVTPKPAKKTNPFPLLEDEDDLFRDQKGKKNESKSNHQQDVISKSQDIFEDDIFATEAIKPSQKTREKERTFESNLFDDNIDIFADLTIKPKEKSKKKVEAKSIFADDMDDIFSSGVQAKTTKPKSRSSQAVPELKSEQKVSNIFDDPLNAFGGQ